MSAPPLPSRRCGSRPLRRRVASFGAAALLAVGIVTGTTVLPVGADAAPSDGVEISAQVAAAAAAAVDAAAAQVLPSGDIVAIAPESGPQLTADAWRRAIGQAVVEAGATKLGAPYVYSAGGPNAFDCSGFVRWAWLQLGVALPHNSVAMWNVVERIPVAEMQAGDIVFDSVGGPPAHVGIYVGDGWMIHAPNGGGRVRYDRVGWWTGATVTAGRVVVPA